MFVITFLLAAAMLVPASKPSQRAPSDAVVGRPVLSTRAVGLLPAPASVCEARHLHSGFLAEIDIGARDAIGGSVFSVPSPAGELVVSVAPRAVRAEGFRIVLSPKPGVFEDLPLPEITTFRGGLRNVSDAPVAGSIVDGEVSLVILMPDGTRSAVEPFGGPQGMHLVDDTAERVDLGVVCGVGHDAGVDEGRAGGGGHGEDAQDDAESARKHGGDGMVAMSMVAMSMMAGRMVVGRTTRMASATAASPAARRAGRRSRSMSTTRSLSSMESTRSPLRAGSSRASSPRTCSTTPSATSSTS